MLRRTMLCLLSALVLPAAAALPSYASSAAVATARPDRDVLHVTRQYGGRPVVLPAGDMLDLELNGRRGDRVRLAIVERDEQTGQRTYRYARTTRVALKGPDGRRVVLGDTGFFRLRSNGVHRLSYRASQHHGARLQLVKQVRVEHRASSVTEVPARRGFQYAVGVRVRADLDVVSFGTDLQRVLAPGARFLEPGGQSLVVAPGLSPMGRAQFGTSEPLEQGQRFYALLDVSAGARVVSTRPDEVPAALDGPGTTLAAVDGVGAVVAELDAAAVASSAGRLVRSSLVGEAPEGWSALVLGPDGRPVPRVQPGHLHLLAASTGTYRVLAFPWSVDAGRASLQLDSVVDGGTIAVDGPVTTVPVRADGRFTLLTIAGPTSPAALAVTATDVAAPWTVYAGQLGSTHCGAHSGNGCGEGWGAYVTDAGNSSLPISFGGHVLVMPLAARSGSFDVRLTSVR